VVEIGARSRPAIRHVAHPAATVPMAITMSCTMTMELPEMIAELYRAEWVEPSPNGWPMAGIAVDRNVKNLGSWRAK